MMKIICKIIVVICSVVLCSCGGRSAKMVLDNPIYTPQYAEGFEIFAVGEHSSVLSIKNPWQGTENVTMNIFISKNGEQPPKDFEGTVVKEKPARVVCLSSSHIAFINELGCIDAVKGASGANLITNPTIAERYALGEVREVGYDTNMNYEVLIELRPDIMFIYGTTGENSALTTKLKELNIPTVYIGDYLEKHPLGKSEWIVAFGEIFGFTKEASAKFNEIKKQYIEIKTLAEKVSLRPSVMLNSPYRDSWFVPSDDSYIVTLIRDAGGHYICEGTKGNVTRPISIEKAYQYASNADVWLNPGQARSVSELVAENPKFADINIVKEGEIYNHTKRSTLQGGNDFWESGALNAHLILKDIFHILHPQEGTTFEEGYYYERVK